MFETALAVLYGAIGALTLAPEPIPIPEPQPPYRADNDPLEPIYCETVCRWVAEEWVCVEICY